MSTDHDLHRAFGQRHDDPVPKQPTSKLASPGFPGANSAQPRSRIAAPRLSWYCDPDVRAKRLQGVAIHCGPINPDLLLRHVVHQRSRRILRSRPPRVFNEAAQEHGGSAGGTKPPERLHPIRQRVLFQADVQRRPRVRPSGVRSSARHPTSVTSPGPMGLHTSLVGGRDLMAGLLGSCERASAAVVLSPTPSEPHREDRG